MAPQPKLVTAPFDLEKSHLRKKPTRGRYMPSALPADSKD